MILYQVYTTSKSTSIYVHTYVYTINSEAWSADTVYSKILIHWSSLSFRGVSLVNTHPHTCILLPLRCAWHSDSWSHRADLVPPGLEAFKPKTSTDGTFTSWQALLSTQTPWQTALTANSRGLQKKRFGETPYHIVGNLYTWYRTRGFQTYRTRGFIWRIFLLGG